MLNKKLIKNNFQKSLNTYDKNAIVQEKMAEFLVSFLNKKKYEKILEIGSYTGILTKKIIKKVEFEKYLALDLVDSFDCIKGISKKIEFQNISIENFKTEEKFDLIISNASLQWVEDFAFVIKKLKNMLNPNGLLLISIFGKNNLIEIKNTFDIGLEYLDLSQIKEILPEAKIIEKEETLKFNSSIEVLKHLKYTGVNSIKKNILTISEIKNKLKILNDKYQNQITYNPIYIIE